MTGLTFVPAAELPLLLPKKLFTVRSAVFKIPTRRLIAEAVDLLCTERYQLLVFTNTQGKNIRGKNIPVADGARLEL
jgi:hypothetical protein